MAEQQQHGEGDATVRAANAPIQTSTGRRKVGIFVAVLTSLALGGLITQLRLSSGTEDDMPGQLVVRPDGGLVELGRDDVDHTTCWLWTMAFTKLKLLARLAVCTAAVTMAWGIFAAKRTPQMVADTKVDKEKEEAIAALQELQEAHSTLQEEQIALKEKLTVLEAKARTTLAETERIVDALTASNRGAERERGETAAVLQQLEEKHAALAKCLAEKTGRGDAVRREQAATQSALEVAEAALTVSQSEAVAAQAEALAEKERAADALSVLKRDTSASLERVVRESTVKTKLAEKDQLKMARAIRGLQRGIMELKGNVKDEKRRVYAANMAMQQLKKKKAELISALSKAEAETATLQQDVAELEVKLEAAAATAARRDAEEIATRAPTSSECESAIRDGNVDILKQAMRSGDPIDTLRKNKKACYEAAEHGHVEVLQWLRANGCPWDETACSQAAMMGHLEVLQWLRTNGCPWDETACSQAAWNGHLEVLQWLRANGCPWGETACSQAARNGHLEVLQWLRTNGCPWDETACPQAATYGHLDVLQWLKANGCPWDKTACSWAAWSGHVEVLQWRKANGCPWDETAYSWAAINGHLEVLQWLRAHGCPWNEKAGSWAAWSGHLEILQWLRAIGCPWDETACSEGAERGHVEVLQWLRANGCRWDEKACSQAAKKRTS